jgi:4-amino-4-deoxy-L-arabinose transferase-like glycosyltransferase
MAGMTIGKQQGNAEWLSSGNRRLILIGLMLVGLVLRVYDLGGGAWQGDEARLVTRMLWMLRGIQQILTLRIDGETPYYFYGFMIHTHPPAELLGTMIGLLFGVSEFSSRLPFVLFGIALIPLVAWVGKRFFDVRVGLAAATLVAVSPYFVGWSRVAQYQTLHLIGSTLLLWTMWRVACQPTFERLRWAALTFALTLLIHVDFIVLAPVMVALALPVMRRKGWWRTTLRCLPYLLPGIVFHVVWISVSAWKAPYGTGFFYMFETRAGAAKPMWENIQFYLVNYFPDPTLLPLFLLALAGTIALLARPISYEHRLLYALMFSWIGLFIAFFFFVNRVPNAYLQEILIPVVLLAGAGVVHTVSAPRVRRLVLGGVALYCLALNVLYLAWAPEWANMKAVWGFRPETAADAHAAAYLVRACTDPDTVVATNVDGQIAALYFDRKPFGCNESTREACFARFQAEQGALASASGHGASVGQMSYALAWSDTNFTLPQTFYVELSPTCSLQGMDAEQAAASFLKTYGSLERMREQPPWR